MMLMAKQCRYLRGNTFYVDESFFIAPADRFPTLFEAVYDSKEEVLRELKERFEKYLPENFDYEGRFVHYIELYLVNESLIY